MIRDSAALAPVRVGYLTYGLDRHLSGIGRYAVELARALRTHQGEVALTLMTPFAGSPAGLDAYYPNHRLQGRLLPTLMTVGPPQLALHARQHGLQVVHDPHGISPFLIPRRFGRFARLVTIHDMVPFVYPDTHTRLTNLLFRRYIPKTLPSVYGIITDSQASRYDIMRFYGIPGCRIHVVYCGVSSSFRPTKAAEVERVLRRYEIDAERPYILTVGALQARKNLETLFEAYRLLRQRGRTEQLVVVGRKAWKTDGIFRRLAELGLDQEVRLTGYIEDDDLPALYSGAATFAFPSLYEGFGLPPLEALACGTPVVVSNSSSLPEVVGNAALQVEPRDPSGFANAIERLLDDDQLRRELRARGLQRAAEFTWERAAAAHVALYVEASHMDSASGLDRGDQISGSQSRFIRQSPHS